jgi:DNA-binding NtrC family response regulator
MQDVVAAVFQSLALSKLVGSSPAFTQALRHLPQMARSEAPVLLLGETGTGKELTARALHSLSPRAGGPFVPVNCGALPDSLLEDELFGHEAGAFTDAREARRGLIAQAEKGTLFLDEVDSLSRKAQASLLRVLQDQRYRPLGARQEHAADVRLITACNTPLEEPIHEGAFRRDLYFRLCVFGIYLPPLRERPDDLLPLAEHFLAKYAPPGHPRPGLSASSRQALWNHDWPGNVRELENVIRRAVHLCEGAEIEVDHLGLPAANGQGTATDGPGEKLLSFHAAKRRAIEHFERSYLTSLMATYRGNVSQAARAAGKDRSDLSKLLRKYRIRSASFRKPSQPLPVPDTSSDPPCA